MPRPKRVVLEVEEMAECPECAKRAAVDSECTRCNGTGKVSKAEVDYWKDK